MNDEKDVKITDIPDGCRPCGGDYPMCRDACPLIDEE